MKERYFKVINVYTNPMEEETIIGTLIIRAKDSVDALRINNRHEDELSTLPREALLKDQMVKSVNPLEFIVTQRRKGIGGSIWYEDDEGKLQKETK
jgi:hypothetical protein